MNKKLKLFGLLALTLALGAGAAWALVEPAPIVLSGTYAAGVTLDKYHANNSEGDTFNTITGNGIITGSVHGDVLTGDGAGAAPGAGGPGPMVLALNADAGNTVTLAPAATEKLAQTNNAGAVQAQHATDNLQVIVNGPVDLADNADNTNNGTVLIKGANGDNPSNTVFNQYYGGTFVYGGTLSTTQNNALGHGWVALLARSARSSRPGATFDVNGTTKLQLGIEDPASKVTGQPVYLVRDVTEPAAATNRKVQQAFINVDSVGDKKQELWLNHGLGEVLTYTDATNADNVATATAWDDTLLNLTALSPLTNTTNVATATRVAQLVKTGAGLLYIGSDGTGLAGNLAAITGARHEGGTVVRGGTLKIDGKNATTWRDRYTGYLGSVWDLAALVQNDSYLANSANNTGAIHNPLYLENDAKVIVDRAQIFSFFRGAADTEFTANQFSLAGVNERPVIFVTLNNEHSDFAGKLSGSFDLVVDSKVSALGLVAGSAVTPGQAQLRLGKAENDITGLTRVDNGVLSVAGANSIAPKGPGTLTVGTGVGRALPADPFRKAVFLAVADSTFMNRTIVRGPRVNLKPSTATDVPPRLSPNEITADGALAAASDTKVAFNDVTIDGSMEINPRAVVESITAGAQDDIRWTDSEPYPLWSGTVAFGEGVSADYDIGGDVNNITQIAVSRGTWHLGKLPKEAGFANVMLRQAATLSLADGVRDFSPFFDVQVDDDSRIRVVVKPEDVAASREAAMLKDPIFKAREIDYTWLGTGNENKDRRLVLMLDISALENQLKVGDWIKVVGSKQAINWNHLHYLRESSTTDNEDKVKVVVGFYGKDGKHLMDINLGDTEVSKLRPLDESSWSIMVPVTKAFDGNDTPAPAPEKDLKADIKAPAEVKLGTDVTFELGKWTYKASADVEVQDVKWMLDGVDKTADVKDSKLTVKAEKEGTMNLVVTAKLKADPTVDGEAKVSVAVKKDGGSSSSGGSSGGCDAGFAGLALLLAAPLFLRKRD